MSGTTRLVKELAGAYALTLAALLFGAVVLFVMVGPVLLIDREPGDPSSAWAVARPWISLAVIVALVGPPFMVWSTRSTEQGGFNVVSVAVAAVPVSVMSYMASRVTSDSSSFGVRDILIVWTILIASATGWQRRAQVRESRARAKRDR